MSSTFGEHLKLSIFGQSHGAAIGMVLDGIPAGLKVDLDALDAFLARRAPGRNAYSTPRREEDKPEFLSGIVDGVTCGAPIGAVIYNTNTRPRDYAAIADCPRPGHADFTAQIKYGGFQDASGGGHFSGRLTAPLCIAGGLCLQWLARLGVTIRAHLLSVGNVYDEAFDTLSPQFERLQSDFPVLSAEAGKKMRDAIACARADCDSLGGVIECAVTGLPAGLGEPMFGGMEGKIAAALYAVPAVKGVEFGDGFGAALHRGSENNDAYCVRDGRIVTATNHAGGILGGITNGMPLIFRLAVKPTPSIAKPQQSVRLSDRTEQTITVKGRHDPCIAPRAVCVAEAAAAIAIFDAYLMYQKPFGGI